MTDRSSGVLVRKPKYIDRILVNHPTNGNGWVNRIQSGNFMPLSTTHGSPIGYREITISIGNGSSGKTRYIYNSPVEIPDFFEYIYPIDYPAVNVISATQDWARGNISRIEMYNNENTVIQSTDHNYNLEVIKNKPALFPGIEMRTVESLLTFYDPQNCGGTCSENISIYNMAINVHTTGFMNMGSSTQTRYSSNGDKMITTTEHEYYNVSDEIQLPRRITETNSNNEKRITEYVYAHEKEGYSHFIEQNMLSQPYSVTVKDENEDVISKHWILYDDFDGKWKPCGKWLWDGAMDGGEPKAPQNCSSN